MGLLKLKNIFFRLTLFISCLCLFATENSALADIQKVDILISEQDQNINTIGYTDYLKIHSDAKLLSTEIPVDITNFTSVDENARLVNNLKENQGVFLETAAQGIVNWTVNIPQSGFYSIKINYYPVKGKGSDIVRALYIDNQIPFTEAGSLAFPRIYEDDGDPKTDIYGNQIRPSQIETPDWQTTAFFDSAGYYAEPLLFYFESGIRFISMESIREPVIIASLTLFNHTKPESYKEYLKPQFKEASEQYVEIQGENAVTKSSNMLYPISDVSSSGIHPSSYDTILLNTIGGMKWQDNGQWIKWDFFIKESGLYKIAIKARQSIQAGQPSYRRFYIDDQIPYNEAEIIKFNYSTKWNTQVLSSNEQPLLFYLTAGEHSIKLEVALGELADAIKDIKECMLRLNDIYKDFLVFTGPNPDLNRDYDFPGVLPETMEKLNSESKKLKKLYLRLSEVNGIGGSQSEQLQILSNQAKKMYKHPERIAKILPSFLVNISNLGNLLATLQKQPLEIDYISIASPDMDFPKTNESFFSSIGFLIKQFIASFFTEYNKIGVMSDETAAIKIWMTAGRDQANSLNQLIMNNFTSRNKIITELQLVPAGTLLTATLADKGPDIALNISEYDPINFAIRGAVLDLSQFKDFDKIKNRFLPSAISPLTFDGSIYGLPETQSFPMLFYRKDILREFDLAVPKTWDEVLMMLPILQKKNLNIALQQPYIPNVIGVGISGYAMFLFQNGGNFYNPDATASALDSDVGIEAFYQWTDFYNKYQLPVQFDFNTRFRNGEIPIGIADYSTYNYLIIFAPELEGLWGFAPVPGILKDDGSIDNTVASTISASIIMSNTKNKSDCWEFMKWWTSTEIQAKYGNELESVMGAAGRYQPANVEALYSIPWNNKDFEILSNQMKKTKGIPQIPGSYMTPRYLDFAFKQAYTGTADINSYLSADEIIQDASKMINKEIKEKRKEFGFS